MSAFADKQTLREKLERGSNVLALETIQRQGEGQSRTDPVAHHLFRGASNNCVAVALSGTCRLTNDATLPGSMSLVTTRTLHGALRTKEG